MHVRLLQEFSGEGLLLCVRGLDGKQGSGLMSSSERSKQSPYGGGEFSMGVSGLRFLYYKFFFEKSQIRPLTTSPFCALGYNRLASNPHVFQYRLQFCPASSVTL